MSLINSRIFDIIRKEKITKKWTNSEILSKTADKWPPVAGEKPKDVDPIHGLTYMSGMTKREQESLCTRNTQTSWCYWSNHKGRKCVEIYA